MSTLERYERLKDLALKRRRDADRAAGVVALLRKQAKERFGVSSLEEAESLLSAWRERADSLEEQIRTTLDELEGR